MNQYVGNDVALGETKIHVLDEAGGRVWRGKCASHPDEIEATICKHAPGGADLPRDWAVDHLALDGTA
jgi:transposase